MYVVVLLALTPHFLSYLLFQLRSRGTKKTNRLVMSTLRRALRAVCGKSYFIEGCSLTKLRVSEDA